MARPKNKQDLLDSSNEKFNKLIALINSLSKEEQEGLFDMTTYGKENHWARDKSIKDILIHLYEWHQLSLNWVNSNLNGEKASFLPEGYHWKNYGTLNLAFVEKHKQTKFNDAMAMIKESHQQLIVFIKKMTNDELFVKKYYNWTGSTSLGQYLVSSTASHYDWGYKKVKLYKTKILLK